MALLSAEQAASHLHLNVKRVQALARAGKLPGRRVGRKWLFDERDLEAALGQTETAADGLDLSARNQLRGRILALAVDGLMAEVRIGIGDQELVSIITRSSAERLKLAVGQSVYAVIKSTEVMIAKGQHDAMNSLLWVALVAFGLPALTPRLADPEPGTLTVYAAASLTESFRDLGRSLEQKHPGLKVEFSFAGSQQLALQPSRAPPADLFASADQRWMDYAKDKGPVRERPRCSPGTGWS